MRTALIVDTSPNPFTSVTRVLTDEVARKLSENEGISIVRRDIGVAPPPHLDGQTIGAAFTPPEDRVPEQGTLLALSDELVDELLEADIIVIGSPMHNFGLTSSLKTYLDHVVRVGRTFHYTEDGPVPLVPEGKTVVALTSRGSIYRDEPMRSLDMQENYLTTVMRFIGLSDIRFIHCEGTNVSEETKSASMASAKAEIGTLLDGLLH